MTTNDPSGNRQFLDHVLHLNVVLVALSVVVTHLAFGVGEGLWGVLSGGLVGIANYAAMCWLGRRILDAPRRPRAFYAALFVGKLTVLFGVIAAILTYLPVDAIGFLVGVSLLLPSILGVFFWHALLPEAPADVEGRP